MSLRPLTDSEFGGEQFPASRAEDTDAHLLLSQTKVNDAMSAVAAS
jgi:hypothetical protein